MIAPARSVAYDILCAISAGRADLPAAIAYARGTLEDERDRALAAEIATGVQRWRGALDHVIVHFAKRPIARLDREIVEILRLSAYQLLHLTRVPASAVVDDAVNLAKRERKTSASGLVNAVLRAISRHRDSLPLPPVPADATDRSAALDYLSISLSHPRWLAARWYDRFGFEGARTWMEFNNRPAPLTLRLNRLRMDRDELLSKLRADDVETTPTRFAPDGLVVESGHPLRGPALDEGWFVVQDEASQLVALLAGDRPGPRVLDTCASPGGKTTAIASAMSVGGAPGRIIACDVRDKRIELLRRTVQASGATNVLVVQADLLQPLPFSGRFDCVIVDAPCSGLGTLRRDPDIRWRRREEDLAELSAAQLRMLQHAGAMVAPGGRLVYATCSSEPDENEAVIDRFVTASPAFQIVPANRASTVLPHDVVDSRGFLRTLPHVHALEAFFGAVLQLS
ncbi:MAG TPA: 16S rRNA (cytosine(967)-C(5))-methyltransferase RsmB [Vicinamibacterales bacterium]